MCLMYYLLQIDFHSVARAWRSSRREAAVAAGTCAAGVLVGVEAAVLGGALASLAGLLRDLLRAPALCALAPPRPPGGDKVLTLAQAPDLTLSS